MEAAEDEYSAHKQKVPVKLQIAYNTIAKMEAKITLLQSTIDRYEEALREIAERCDDTPIGIIASNALKK